MCNYSKFVWTCAWLLQTAQPTLSSTNTRARVHTTRTRKSLENSISSLKNFSSRNHHLREKFLLAFRLIFDMAAKQHTKKEGSERKWTCWIHLEENTTNGEQTRMNVRGMEWRNRRESLSKRGEGQRRRQRNAEEFSMNINFREYIIQHLSSRKYIRICFSELFW